MIEQLHKNWHQNLGSLIRESKDEIFISSPFVTQNGVDFVLNNIDKSLRESGTFTFLTNLSPTNIIQGSNNPKVFERLISEIQNMKIWHLPKLHAKVYISDRKKSIITSGNLTNGGLFSNFEYGIQINQEVETQKIYQDINQYCQLGSLIEKDTLLSLIDISSQITRQIPKLESNISSEIKNLLESAQNELVKDRLNVGAIHNVFSKTILYVLEKNPQGLKTEDIHQEIKEIHPDLCDDLIDRIIDGKSFGKKWKHAVRTSQQHLKKSGLIILENDKWKLLK
ncbi:MAG: phospholipase D-like domain-containing protein [Bacteroidetes bacterium]|jgi:HKD family nuclease|nr:phospholipase D-like domain-containing protein [Bacteroidota bacterium]